MKNKVFLSVVVFLVVVTTVIGAIFMNIKKQNDFYKSQPLNLPDGFTYTAHTGCVETDDNSLESIKLGAENGAHIVEFDLWLENGKALLSHNEPEGDEVTLADAFKTVSEYEKLKVNVDVKKCDDYTLVLTLAEKYNVKERIFFTGIFADETENVKNSETGIPYYLNADVKSEKYHTEEYLNELIMSVKNSGAIGINFNKDNASKELVDAFHENGLLVSVWTVNKEDDMYKILYFAPDNITTRNPDVLKTIL